MTDLRFGAMHMMFEAPFRPPVRSARRAGWRTGAVERLRRNCRL
jgi:hypothetical protein